MIIEETLAALRRARALGDEAMAALDDLAAGGRLDDGVAVRAIIQSDVQKERTACDESV